MMKPPDRDAPVVDHLQHVVQSIGTRGGSPGVVVVMDEPTEWDARPDVQEGQHGIEDGAADVLEVDVDAACAD